MSCKPNEGIKLVRNEQYWRPGRPYLDGIEWSVERDQEKRRQLVWEIDRKLQEDEARPILFHNRFATCWHPQVKGLTIMVNSLFNGWRMEGVWLDK